ELFPQHYFAYHEDVQLGLALRFKNARIIKEPRAAAAHLEGSTARQLKKARLRFYQERNRMLNIAGFYPAWLIWRLLPLLILTNLAAKLSALFTSPASCAGMFAAHIWLVCCPGEIMRWRRRCRGLLRTDDELWIAEMSGQLRGQGGPINS